VLPSAEEDSIASLPLWYAMYHVRDVALWLTVPLAIVAAAFLVRRIAAEQRRSAAPEPIDTQR
jgi:hypothetical protein